tara:strand:+ start:258 stop:734 length:477 start_codon:yes stop_codon:yes gene_type:complete
MTLSSFSTIRDSQGQEYNTLSKQGKALIRRYIRMIKNGGDKNSAFSTIQDSQGHEYNTLSKKGKALVREYIRVIKGGQTKKTNKTENDKDILNFVTIEVPIDGSKDNINENKIAYLNSLGDYDYRQFIIDQPLGKYYSTQYIIPNTEVYYNVKPKTNV